MLMSVVVAVALASAGPVVCHNVQSMIGRGMAMVMTDVILRNKKLDCAGLCQNNDAAVAAVAVVEQKMV